MSKSVSNGQFQNTPNSPPRRKTDSGECRVAAPTEEKWILNKKSQIRNFSRYLASEEGDEKFGNEFSHIL